MTGRVKSFHENKGYGVIQQDAGGRALSFHYTDIEGQGFRTLHEGERVEYEIARDRGGFRAIKVKSLEHNDPIER